MSSNNKQTPLNSELDRYISNNYELLVLYARKYTHSPADLVHHTYIKVREAGFAYINEPMTDYYMRRSIRNNAIRSSFKDDYTYSDTNISEIAETPDNTRRIQLEQVDAVLRRLDYFDRTIFELYLSGQNMKQLCDESAIPKSTVYHTLHRVRTTLKNMLNDIHR